MTDSDTYSSETAIPIGEAARLLGVSVGTVRNWERNGKLQSFRTPGKQRRFPIEQIRALKGQTAALRSPQSAGATS
ncbi:MerR family transcriptional regulator [Microbacterium halotolerans]|uniref:MerR family transcriptional regulator n=1 Tax=Microbacterium halotolerans TaxID=246613 RepID=UPI000E6A9739|nr:helix-turn-helix domain-containing protein [Microbacterium halotolerans]